MWLLNVLVSLRKLSFDCCLEPRRRRQAVPVRSGCLLAHSFVAMVLVTVAPLQQRLGSLRHRRAMALRDNKKTYESLDYDRCENQNYRRQFFGLSMDTLANIKRQRLRRKCMHTVGSAVLAHHLLATAELLASPQSMHADCGGCFEHVF